MDRIAHRVKGGSGDAHRMVRDIDAHNRNIQKSEKTHFNNEVESRAKYYAGAVGNTSTREYKNVLPDKASIRSRWGRGVIWVYDKVTGTVVREDQLNA